MARVANRGLSHIVIRVADVAVSSDWYARMFGYEIFIEERDKPQPRTMGNIGDLALEIVKAPTAARADENAPGYALMSFVVDDIAVAHAALQEGGSAKSAKIVEMANVKIVLFRDPDGILLEIIQLPAGLTSMADMGRRMLARKREKAA
jgi:catechol 2,3-dioxygenase-like lactoylglutathione lyase family enzyme